MNRSQLVEEIASSTGLSKRQAEDAVDAFVGTIGDQVRTGSKVTIYGFGSFNPTQRKARTGRNPRTGAPVKIAASKGIRFSPATGFKADLNAKKAGGRKAAAAKATGRVTAKAAPAKATKATKATKGAAAPAKTTARKAAVATKAVGRPKKAAATAPASKKAAPAARASAKKAAAPAKAAKKAAPAKAVKATKAAKASKGRR